MLSVDDANKLTVPLGIYISKDEPVDEASRTPLILDQYPADFLKVYQSPRGHCEEAVRDQERQQVLRQHVCTLIASINLVADAVYQVPRLGSYFFSLLTESAVLI
jgi:hypothetical protein